MRRESDRQTEIKKEREKGRERDSETKVRVKRQI